MPLGPMCAGTEGSDSPCARRIAFALSFIPRQAGVLLPVPLLFLTLFCLVVCLCCASSLGLTIPPPASSKPGKDDVKIEISKPFKGHKLDPPPAYAYTNPQELLQYYKVMAYYRRFEIVADTMYKQRLIRGFCHLYDGQEAIVTGMDAALQRTDSVITAYRDHCHQLSRGDSGESVMSELMVSSSR